MEEVVGGFNRRFGKGLVGRNDWCKEARIHVSDREGRKCGSVSVASKEAATGFLLANCESGRRVFTGDRTGSEIGNHAKVLDDRHA